MISEVIGKDLANIRTLLIDVLKREKYFMCDICSGNYKVDCDGVSLVCTPDRAFDYFSIFFGDKCFVRKTTRSDDGSVKSSCYKIKKEELRAIFNTISTVVTYNSRIDTYNEIPEWDGVPRIDTFLRDIFKCDANPNFFRLYLTSIVGMMKDPANTYVPYFFDFVGMKGVGKSLLHQFLVGADSVTQIEPSSRTEDVLVQIYSRNTIIAVDDECMLTDPQDSMTKRIGWSENKLKNFTTRTLDIFSRKFGQPETRIRSFVFVRTSNFPKSSTDPDERRQIIFESGLEKNNCRLFAYGKENFEQLMSEAKAYYEEHGVYKLTKEDKEEVSKQQAAYFDDETTNFVIAKRFIDYVINLIKLKSPELELRQINGKYIIQWKDFDEYRLNVLHSSEKLTGRFFWKIMRGLEAKGAPIRITEMRHKIFNGNRVTFAYVLPDTVEL